jgi:hypothetical protein
MRPFFTVAFAIVSVTGTTAAVRAQDEGIAASRLESEQLLAEFADCVVSKRSYRAAVAAFERAVPGTPEGAAAAHKAADLSCLNNAAQRKRSRITMRLQPETFRDALYPALYRRRFPQAPSPAALSALPPMELAPEFDGDVAALPQGYTARRSLGDCVARRDPVNAHAMVVAGVGKPAEAAAVAALKPAIAACLPAGTTLRLDLAALRAYTGESLYKLAVAAAPTPRPAG